MSLSYLFLIYILKILKKGQIPGWIVQVSDRIFGTPLIRHQNK